MSDYSVFEVGNTLFPLVDPSANTLLRDADPTIFFALDFYRSMIEMHVGARLIDAMQAAGLQMPDGSIPIKSVGDTLPWDPTPYLTSGQFKFPLLAVFRKSVTERRLTVGFEDDRSTIGVHFILPPMTAGQAEQIVPILGAVWKLLRARTTQGYDPNYTPPGGNQGDKPWTAPFANAEEMGLVSAQFGEMAGEGNLHFPAVLMEGMFVERDNVPPQSAANLAQYEGADIIAALVADDGTSINPFVQVSTQPAPTIIGISPLSGTVAGGTSVTITGTGFDPNWTADNSVMFGSLLATNVVVVNPTQITCLSPAASGSGLVSVSMFNGDGQAADMPSAFSYTYP